MSISTQTNIHLRGDELTLDVTHVEGNDWQGLSIAVASSRTDPVSRSPFVQFFFHDDERNGYADEAVMRFVDELVEASVQLRTRALQRIRERQLRADIHAQANELDELTQDECDILGLDSRSGITYRYRDLTNEQRLRLRRALTEAR